MQSSGLISMLLHHWAGHDGSPATCHANDAEHACVALIHIHNRGAAATRAALQLTWFFFPFNLRLSTCYPQAFFIFVTFFFLPFISPSESSQRGGMTRSHPTSTLLRPPGAPPLPTHTSAATRLYIYSPLPNLHSLPHTFPPCQRHIIIFCRPLCLLMTLFLITRLEQGGPAALLWCLLLPSVFFPSFSLKK